jgi:predicted XRE-type DNA-binding protein
MGGLYRKYLVVVRDGVGVAPGGLKGYAKVEAHLEVAGLGEQSAFKQRHGLGGLSIFQMRQSAEVERGKMIRFNREDLFTMANRIDEAAAGLAFAGLLQRFDRRNHDSWLK